MQRCKTTPTNPQIPTTTEEYQEVVEDKVEDKDEDKVAAKDEDKVAEVDQLMIRTEKPSRTFTKVVVFFSAKISSNR